MNNLSQKLYWKRACKKDMTYILGARCSNGIVMVGDTKETTEYLTKFAYSKKIMTPSELRLNNVVMASAGLSGLFEEFQRRIIIKIRQIGKTDSKSEYIMTENGFLTLITKVIREMNDDFKDDRKLIQNELQILCATRINPESKLTMFWGDGTSQIVNDIDAIGWGKISASLFHNLMWDERMTMEQTAKLGIFIIQCIQEKHLDESVGYDETNLLPQVVYVPNVELPEDFPPHPPRNIPPELQKRYNKLTGEYPIEELTDEKIKHFIEENKLKIKEFEKFMKKLL